MNFINALKYCTPHPNGTVDLVALIKKHTISFTWGNSIINRLDPAVLEMEYLVSKEWPFHPGDKVAFMRLSHTIVHLDEGEAG